MKPSFFATLALLLVLSGCVALPANDHRVASVAFDKPQDTLLGQVVQASLPPNALSGFRLLPTGGYAFDTRVALARRAQRSLDLQYYLFHDDEAGRALGHEVLAAALRGVRVRILLDDIATEGRDEMLARLSAHPNLEVRVFNPFAGGRNRLFTRALASIGDFGRVNHRMHNKLFVADNAMAITGGRNIGNEYFMQGMANNFIDLDVFAAGAIVPQLSVVFDQFWNSDYAYPISAFARFRLSDDEQSPQTEKAHSLVATEVPDPLGYGPLADEIDRGKLALAWASATVVADSPDKVAGLTEQSSNDTVTSNVVRLMQSAQSEVTVISPYFVPGKVGIAAMQRLADRHIRMVVLTNSLAANDAPLVHVGYAKYRRQMLALGVHLYELSPVRARQRGHLDLFGSSHASLHAKVVMVDRRRLFIGSLNLDARSARTNTEMGLVIDSPALAGELVTLMQADHDESSYRLRLSAKTGDLEWVAVDDGVEVIYTSEPDVGALFAFGLWLIAPLAPEDLL
ncbi:phospholipase D family protein [Actimicrobium antarcticum]|uniref:Phospholipase D family protein n=1 Tax=Actimicrobium antarcticum TaxID=1051899 RepID=A0ABP7TZ66_9BURK